MITKLLLGFVAIYLLFFHCSCGSDNVKEYVRGGDIEFHYYRDCATGYCYVEIEQIGNWNHSWVPCDSILKFLEPCHDTTSVKN